MYPEWVEKIRKEKNVSVKLSKGCYYAYKCTSKIVEGKKHPVTQQTYVGRITEDGFIPAVSTKFTPLKTVISTIGKEMNLNNIESGDKEIISNIYIIKFKKEWYLPMLDEKQTQVLAKYNIAEYGKVKF